MPRLGRALVTAVLVCATSAPAQAQPEAHDDYDRLEARQLGEEGLLLYDRGDYAGALAKLERASAFVEAPTLKVYEARCLVQLGRLIDAEARYLAATAMPLPDQPSEVFLRAQEDARSERAALLPRIPSLEIRLLGADTTGANVRIDGKLVDASMPGARHPVDPGTRRVQARVGAEVRETTVAVREGEHRKVALDFSVSQRAQPPPVEESGMDPLAVVGISAMAVGAAGLIVWGGTGIAAMVRAGELKCEDAMCPAGEDDVTELSRLRTASTVSFWIGVPVLAVGAALLVVSVTLDSNETARLTLGPGFAGVEGTW